MSGRANMPPIKGFFFVRSPAVSFGSMEAAALFMIVLLLLWGNGNWAQPWRHPKRLCYTFEILTVSRVLPVGCTATMGSETPLQHNRGVAELPRFGVTPPGMLGEAKPPAMEELTLH